MQKQNYYQDKQTANARIEIDYRKKGKPTVKFSYPDLKNQSGGTMFAWITFIYILILFLAWYSFITVDQYQKINNYIKNPQNVQDYKECIDMFANDYQNIVSNVCYKKGGLDFKTDYNEFLFNALNTNNTDNKTIIQGSVSPIITNPYAEIKGLALYLLILFGPPSLIYFPFKRQWQGIYPKWNALLSSKRYVYFKTKDIEPCYKPEYKSKGKYFVEIPLFDNVTLRYKAYNDFGKYLCFFEIKEHKFYSLVKNKKIKDKIKDKNKLKALRKKYKVRRIKQIDDHYWRATFYFREKPYKGKMDVLFK